MKCLRTKYREKSDSNTKVWKMNYDMVFIFNDIWEVKDWCCALTQQLSERVSLRLFTPSFSGLHEAEDRGGGQVTGSPADNKLWYWFILSDDSPTNLTCERVQNHTEILKNNKTDASAAMLWVLHVENCTCNNKHSNF